MPDNLDYYDFITYLIGCPTFIDYDPNNAFYISSL